MKMKMWIAIMAIGITSALAGLLVVPGASAAVVHPAQGRTASAEKAVKARTEPLAPGPGTFVSTFLNDGGVTAYPCVDDYDWNYPLIPFYKVGNGCSVRVWLHQYVNWKDDGWSYCISPNSQTDVPVEYEYPLNIYISENSEDCP